jgi:hypothetical protein
MQFAQIPRYRRIVLASLAIVAVAPVNAQDNAADAASLITALAIRAGSVVAEIGAGTGDLTLAIARQAGASGRKDTGFIVVMKKPGQFSEFERCGLPRWPFVFHHSRAEALRDRTLVLSTSACYRCGRHPTC